MPLAQTLSFPGFRSYCSRLLPTLQSSSALCLSCWSRQEKKMEELNLLQKCWQELRRLSTQRAIPFRSICLWYVSSKVYLGQLLLKLVAIRHLDPSVVSKPSHCPSSPNKSFWVRSPAGRIRLERGNGFTSCELGQGHSNNKNLADSFVQPQKPTTIWLKPSLFHCVFLNDGRSFCREEVKPAAGKEMPPRTG